MQFNLRISEKSSNFGRTASDVKGFLAKPKKADGHNHGDYLIGTHREAATTNPANTNLPWGPLRKKCL